MALDILLKKKGMKEPKIPSKKSGKKGKGTLKTDCDTPSKSKKKSRPYMDV
jgi:hypothetical protein